MYVVTIIRSSFSGTTVVIVTISNSISIIISLPLPCDMAATN